MRRRWSGASAWRRAETRRRGRFRRRPSREPGPRARRDRPRSRAGRSGRAEPVARPLRSLTRYRPRAALYRRRDPDGREHGRQPRAASARRTTADGISRGPWQDHRAGGRPPTGPNGRDGPSRRWGRGRGLRPPPPGLGASGGEHLHHGRPRQPHTRGGAPADRGRRRRAATPPALQAATSLRSRPRTGKSRRLRETPPCRPPRAARTPSETSAIESCPRSAPGRPSSPAKSRNEGKRSSVPCPGPDRRAAHRAPRLRRRGATGRGTPRASAPRAG